MDVVSDDVQMAIVLEELSKTLDIYVRENSDRIRPFSRDDMKHSLQLLSSGKSVSFYFSGLPSDFQFCCWAIGVFCKHGGVVCVAMPDGQLRLPDMSEKTWREMGDKTWREIVTLGYSSTVLGWIDL